MTHAKRDGRADVAASRRRARYNSQAARGATKKPCAPAVLSFLQKFHSARELGQYVKTASASNPATNSVVRVAGSRKVSPPGGIGAYMTT
jgi:hypothetical protein